MKFRKIFFFLAAITLFSMSNIYSEDFHQKGDFQLSLRLPLAIPAFTSNIGVDPPETVTFWDTGYRNIIVAVEADVGVFMSPKLSIGGLLGYSFAYDRGENLISRVPLLFRSSYFVYSDYKSEVLLSLGLGVDYLKYRSMEHITPQLSLEAGFNVYWSDNWSASFRTGMNFYAELYADTAKNNISATIPIILGVTYRK